MAHALLWLAALTAGLLWMAAAVALVVRLPHRRRIQIDILIIAALPPLLLSGAAMYLAGALWFSGVRPSWLGYTFSWMLLWLAGSVGIAVFGLRSRDERPLAAGWRPQRFLSAFGIAVAAAFLVFGYLDIAARFRLVQISLEAQRMLSETAPPRVSPADDARPLYEKVYSALESRDLSWISFWSAIDDVASDLGIEEVQTLLRRNSDLRELVRIAASRPYLSKSSQRPFVVPEGFAHKIAPKVVWVPDLPLHETRFIAGLLLLQALDELRIGDQSSCLISMLEVHALARQRGAYGSTLDVHIAYSIEGSAIQVWERILYTAKLKKADLPLLFGRARLNTRIWLQALRASEAEGLLYIAEAGAGNISAAEFSRSLAPLYRVFMMEGDVIAERSATYLKARMLSSPFQGTIRSLEREGFDLRGLHHGLVGRPFYRNDAELLGSMVADASARQALLDCAFAASAFRTERGRYPGTLKELVPDFLHAVPTDPNDGKPIRSVTEEGDGMKIYSTKVNVLPILTYQTGHLQEILSEGFKGHQEIVFYLGESYRTHRLEPALDTARRRQEAEARREEERGVRRRPAAPSAD